jgi:hypothetical protein
MYWNGRSARSISGLSGFCPWQSGMNNERQEISGAITRQHRALQPETIGC